MMERWQCEGKGKGNEKGGGGYVPVTMATLPARRAAFWDAIEDIYAIYIFFLLRLLLDKCATSINQWHGVLVPCLQENRVSSFLIEPDESGLRDWIAGSSDLFPIAKI